MTHGGFVAFVAKAVDFVGIIYGSARDAAVKLFRPAIKAGMVGGMSSSVSQLKIFKSVIGLDAVAVVDDLVVPELASETAFHDEPVLSNVAISSREDDSVASRNLHPTLPVWMQSALHVIHLTSARTISVLASFVATIVSKLLIAVGALEDTLARLVVAGTIAEPSMLAGRSLELSFADLAGVDHGRDYTAVNASRPVLGWFVTKK